MAVVEGKQPNMQRSGFWSGAIVGLLATAAVTTLLHIAHRLVGLPFPPFALFDGISRHLPGGLITAAIDAMVRLIGALRLGPTAEVAKLAEQALALSGFVVTGGLAGGLVFRLLGAWRGSPYPTAVAAGVLIGLLMLPLSLGSRGAAVPAPLAAVWLIATACGWGAALAWCLTRLRTGSVPLSPATRSREAARAEPVDRRTFLVRLGGATAVFTVAGAAVEALVSRRAAAGTGAGTRYWSATHRLPNADDPVVPVSGTRAELTPVPRHYRIDITTAPPQIDGATWRLAVGGLVERDLSFSLDDLRALEPLHQFVTLECISNRVAGDLISTTRWTGVSLQRLIPALGLRPQATHLRLRSRDGFHEVLALDTVRSDPRVMLCYAWDGLPLSVEHGFPLRVYIPDRYGMKQPKWIDAIDALDRWETGYWVQRGWDRDARVRSTVVIDTIATDMMLPRPGVVPLGGIAYAGARGISRVEVRVDDAAWTPAELRAPLSDTTWVLWRFDWPFSAGRHTFTVRCFDGDGVPQVEQPAPPHPSGATGLHSTTAMV